MTLEVIAGKVLAVGLWRGPDGTTPVYTSEAGDETFLVLEGEVEIERVDTGERFHFGPGQICAWSSGMPTRWTLEGGFKKFSAHPFSAHGIARRPATDGESV